MVPPLGEPAGYCGRSWSLTGKDTTQFKLLMVRRAFGDAADAKNLDMPTVDVSEYLATNG